MGLQKTLRFTQHWPNSPLHPQKSALRVATCFGDARCVEYISPSLPASSSQLLCKLRPKGCL